MEAAKNDWPAGKPFTDDDKARISSNLSITMSDYYAISSDQDAKSMVCGAKIAATYTSSDKSKTSTADSLQRFGIYSGENGQFIAIDEGVPVLQQLLTKILRSEQ